MKTNRSLATVAAAFLALVIGPSALSAETILGQPQPASATASLTGPDPGSITPPLGIRSGTVICSNGFAILVGSASGLEATGQFLISHPGGLILPQMVTFNVITPTSMILPETALPSGSYAVLYIPLRSALSTQVEQPYSAAHTSKRPRTKASRVIRTGQRRSSNLSSNRNRHWASAPQARRR